MKDLLREVGKSEVSRLAKTSIPKDIQVHVEKIIDDIRREGEKALRKYADLHDGVKAHDALFFERKHMQKAFSELSLTDQKLLQRTKKRIEKFAKAQRKSLHARKVMIPGGVCGHSIAAVERAGCYAPGGRYPLPSSVLMTVVTAKVAGVKKVFVASPKPMPLMLAAAFLAGADGFLVAGGAQGIAALAFGLGGVEPCDVIVGPGNFYVTAAKKYLFGEVNIDMLAGPTELVVVADESANPAWVASDLLAQAEHDVSAKPVLIALNEKILENVQKALALQIQTLANGDVARLALQNGFCVHVSSVKEAAVLCNLLAPEHLSLSLQKAKQHAHLFNHYGALFVGENASECLGDYGVGPNHVLPTGGAARYAGGLSVFNFLRVRTFIEIRSLKNARKIYEDAVSFAQIEGLGAHAESARKRLG